MLDRRQVLQLGASAMALPVLALAKQDTTAGDSRPALIRRPIPSSGELLPVMGMGTAAAP